MFQNRNFPNWIAVTKLTAQCDQPYNGARGSSARHGFDTGTQGFCPDPYEKAANTTRSPEVRSDPSRGAAKECSPRRKPWVQSRRTPQVPQGRKNVALDFSVGWRIKKDLGSRSEERRVRERV